jgi:hypothetical protein
MDHRLHHYKQMAKHFFINSQFKNILKKWTHIDQWQFLLSHQWNDQISMYEEMCTIIFIIVLYPFYSHRSRWEPFLYISVVFAKTMLNFLNSGIYQELDIDNSHQINVNWYHYKIEWTSFEFKENSDQKTYSQ